MKIAHSTLSFAFWLLLLAGGYTTRADLPNGTLAKRAVKKALGQEYSATSTTTAKAVISRCLAGWPEAFQHAQRIRQHQLDAHTPLPGDPSTEVDQLLVALNAADAQRHRKIRL